MVDWGANYNVNQTVYSGNDLLVPGAPPAEIVDRTLRPVDPTLDVAGMPITSSRPEHRLATSSVCTSGGAARSWPLREDRRRTPQQWIRGPIFRRPPDGHVEWVQHQLHLPQPTPITTWTSVDAAYRWVMAQLDPNAPVDPRTIKWLTPENKAAIEVTVNSRRDPSDPTSPVTSYTVSIHGEHGLIRLGDLQRSASRVLETLTHTLQFAELAELQGVPGVPLEPHTQQFADQLVTYMTTRRGQVVSRTS